ncbi:MAG: class I SAM-dependent methyltransferase, partial [Pseudomonadota bacterium]
MTDEPKPFVEIFKDPEHAAQYADGPSRFMPGFSSVHRMTSVLIREFAPRDATVLCHGAGGGLELEAFATANPEWTLLGVDPAKPMLDEARVRLGELNERVSLHHGYAEDAPHGPFDAATSFLTLHFLDKEQRRQTVSEIVRRLKPGAPFVTAHCSFPQSAELRDRWLARHQAFTVASGVDPERAAQGRNDIAENLYVYDPEVDEQILREAGLTDVTLFYSAFTWRGWYGCA